MSNFCSVAEQNLTIVKTGSVRTSVSSGTYEQKLLLLEEMKGDYAASMIRSASIASLLTCRRGSLTAF